MSFPLLLLKPAKLCLNKLAAAILGGDRRHVTPVDKIRNFDEKSFRKKNITPLPRTQTDFRECVTLMNF